MSEQRKPPAGWKTFRVKRRPAAADDVLALMQALYDVGVTFHVNAPEVERRLAGNPMLEREDQP